jgi:hypothetical protein
MIKGLQMTAWLHTTWVWTWIVPTLQEPRKYADDTLQAEIYSTTPLHRPEWESCCFDIVRASSDWSWLAFLWRSLLHSLVETWVGTDTFNKPAWEIGLQPTCNLYKNSLTQFESTLLVIAHLFRCPVSMG